MIQSSFARVVGFAASVRHNRIGGAGEHEGDRESLIPKNRIGFLGEKIVASDVYEERLSPESFGKFAFRSGNGIDRSGVQNKIDASELENSCAKSVSDATCGAEIHANGGGALRTRQRSGLFSNFFCARFVEVSHHNVRAATSENQHGFASDSVGSSYDEADFPAELRFGRHALEFHFFERPVFDAKRFRAGKRHIVVKVGEPGGLFGAPRLRKWTLRVAVFEGICASHYVDRVDEELCCDARLFLVFAEAEESDAGYDNDGRVRVAKLG